MIAEPPALRAEPAAWDAFVAAAPTGAYPQLSAWAAVKAANGWDAERVVAESSTGPIGAQVLVHRIGATPWSMGYAPRGPLAARFDREAVLSFTAAARDFAARRRLSHVMVDPEISDPGVTEHLREAGWQPAPAVQPERTWVVDLDVPEETLWSGLRSKWRQYVQKARRGGVVVVEGDASGFDEFYSVFVETARRAGFLYRTLDSYRRVYDAFAARGSARLLFARLPDGTAGATIMLVACGPRVVEPYGGMTSAGADLRANYLLKWEAIRSSRERGARVYDMWGMAHPGIEQFKRGFGGREVRYIGAFDLVRVGPVRTILLTGQRLRVAIARRRAPRDQDGRTAGGAGVADT